MSRIRGLSRATWVAPDKFQLYVDGLSKLVDAHTGEETAGDVEASAAQPADALPSPNEDLELHRRNSNLEVRDRRNGTSWWLTTDGEPYFEYGGTIDGNQRSVTERRFGRIAPPVALWSPDGRYVLAHQVDQRSVGESFLVQEIQAGDQRPKLLPYREALFGDPSVPQVTTSVIEVTTGRHYHVPHPNLFRHLEPPIAIGYAWWSSDSRFVYLIHSAPGDRKHTLYEYDVEGQTIRSILNEQSDTFADLNPLAFARPLIRVLPSRQEVLIWSQRNGWGHIWVHDLKTGTELRAMTHGEWVVRDLLGVDESEGWAYFLGAGREPGRDPYLRHLYRVRIDGGEPELLTPEDSDHDISMAPDMQGFVDVHSRIDTPPVALLRRADGTLVRELSRADFSVMISDGWRPPERFVTKAEDGTPLYGAIYFPSDFDPTAKYPVIDDVYAGPVVPRVSKRFPDGHDPKEEYDYWIPQAVAELGFVVFVVDGRGSPYRNKAFHDFGYRSFSAPIPDHVATLHQLAESRPYMDLSRVGVWGHSAGGFVAARALLDFPEVFHVGVSSAGPHVMTMNPWYERNFGLEPIPRANFDNCEVAHRLTGKLLIVYGELDENVHPVHAVRFADALMGAGKEFELVVMPDANHFYYGRAYFLRRLFGFLTQHLLGYDAPPEREFVDGPFEARFRYGPAGIRKDAG